MNCRGSRYRLSLNLLLNYVVKFECSNIRVHTKIIHTTAFIQLKLEQNPLLTDNSKYLPEMVSYYSHVWCVCRLITACLNWLLSTSTHVLSGARSVSVQACAKRLYGTCERLIVEAVHGEAEAVWAGVYVWYWWSLCNTKLSHCMSCLAYHAAHTWRHWRHRWRHQQQVRVGRVRGIDDVIAVVAECLIHLEPTRHVTPHACLYDPRLSASPHSTMPTSPWSPRQTRDVPFSPTSIKSAWWNLG